MKEQIKISVIIPVKDLSYYLMYENLPAFDQQIFHEFEVIVLTNEQSLYDFTLVKKYPWLRIIPTGKVTRPAKKRDLGVKAAKGTLIAFIDDDASPSKNWLSVAFKIYNKAKKHNVNFVAVCGPGILPKTSTFREKINYEILKSPFGSATYRYRFIKMARRQVDDYPSMNFIIEKSTFLKAGGFNSEYWPGEDSKLCNELIHRLNKKILYDPEIVVYHHPRNSIIGFLKQQSNYGFHRGAFIAHGDKNSINIVYFFPAVFVGYLFALVVLLIVFPTTLNLLIFAPLAIYITFLIFQIALTINESSNPVLALCSAFFLATMHLTYGILFLRGFITGIVKKENIY